MKNFDDEIKKILKDEIEKPFSYELSIKKAFSKKESKILSHSILCKIVLLTSCFIMGCTGVMAVNYLYENIWKDPIILSKNEEEKIIKEDIEDYEKSEFISEEKATEIGNQLLTKLGYENTTITQINLLKGYDSNYSIHYLLRAENILINLNPKTGELEYFGDNSFLDKNIVCDTISEDKVNEIATQIYSDLNFFEENNNYKIVETKKQSIVSGKYANDSWQVSFAKVYNNNIYNKESISTIAFSVYNDNIIIYSISMKNEDNYEKNPIVISKEEAIEIAKNKENEFSNIRISNVSAELSIEKMNIFIYCLENNVTNEKGELKTTDTTRNVWVVNIEHDKNTIPKDGNIETVKKFYNKKYFVDATTGEIIGGEESEFFNE